MYEAARIHDGIGHSGALAGFLVGAAIGAALVAAVAFATFTCGFGAGLLAGLVAGLGASGILMLGEAMGSAIRTPSGKIITGSPNVYTNGRAAARIGDSTECDAQIQTGSSNVFIGGGRTGYLKIKSEVPGAMRSAVGWAITPAGASASHCIMHTRCAG